jgi:hypothetical protein
MRKVALIFFVGVSFIGTVRAQVIVHDPAFNATSLVQWAYNAPTWLATKVDGAATRFNTFGTQINTSLSKVYAFEQKMNSYEQLYRQGAAWNTIGKIPGVGTLARLYNDVGRIRQAAMGWRSFADPQRYASDARYIASSYQQPLGSYATYSGYRVPVQADEYQFDTQGWNLGNNTRKSIDSLRQRQQDLSQELDRAGQAFNAARTTEDRNAYGKAVDLVAAKLHLIDDQITHAQGDYQMQEKTLQHEQNVVETARYNQRRQQDYQLVDKTFDGLPPTVWSGTRWNP